MPKQPAIPGLRDAMKKKVTRREQFLAEMEAVVPWSRLLALIVPHYPKAGPKGGRPPMPLETMLRVHFLQNWYALSDPMAEERLYDSEAIRRFAGIELDDDRIPDETTILNFRHLLERHALTEALFAEVNVHLAEKGISLRSGTLVDATIIDAPSSTRKGKDWHFGSEEDQRTVRGAVEKIVSDRCRGSSGCASFDDRTGQQHHGRRQLLQVHGCGGQQSLALRVLEPSADGSGKSVERSPWFHHRSEQR